ncbi:reverse transcriptase domain-containing protein, partial [Tanacetum coccineum]
RETEETTDKEQSNFQGSTTQILPPVIPIFIPEPDVPKTLPKTTPIPKPDVPKNLPKPNIPYPSRRDDQKSRDKASNQMEKIFQIFQDLHFDISFTDALLLMPRFAPTIKSLLMNKEKLLELAKIPLNENCSAMLLKKLLENLGDLNKFLNLCNFPGIDVCHALADLGASINLMPLSIWKKLSLPELTPTRMTLELADRSITYPKGLAEDVFVKVGVTPPDGAWTEYVSGGVTSSYFEHKAKGTTTNGRFENHNSLHYLKIDKFYKIQKKLNTCGSVSKM